MHGSWKISEKQVIFLSLLRVAIGWHFLYEGMVKLLTPGWSSSTYLELSRWIFAPVFKWIVNTPSVLIIVDWMNILGLILIGLSLIIGLFSRIACFAGIALLTLYYMANPPLVGMDFGVPAEGSYLVVNKNLIELLALSVLALFPTAEIYGLDRFIKTPKSFLKPRQKEVIDKQEKIKSMERRDVLRSFATLPFMGAFAVSLLQKKAWKSQEEKHLIDSVGSASVRAFSHTNLKDLKGTLPKAKIKGVEFSRMILGGNLIGGWAHARDLLYVSRLVKAYHHRDKVFETLLLAEKCGIDTLLTNPVLTGILQEYWRRNIGKIQFISDCGGGDILEKIRISIDGGAAACYVQGGTADELVRRGNFDLIQKGLDLIRQNGLPAGVGGHYIETIKGCVDAGIEPDFWMKTFHHRNYWSANPETEYDNIYCRKPEETKDYMRGLSQPFIAFKTLAAGAIKPEDGFRYAFENGADFICVGMYDFQLIDDVNIVLSILNGNLVRERPWIT